MSQRLIVASLLLGNLLVSVGLAQNSPSGAGGRSSASNVSADLLSIYDRTKSASSEGDMTAIARACSKVVPDAARSQLDRDYASSLLAWALNRRGELRNERAAELVAGGDLKSADELDRQATEDFATAIQYGPANWRTHHNYAISLAMRGDYEPAIQQFNRAIELRPDYANAHFNRGELYFELERYEQAIADYSQAIALTPTDPQFYNSRGHCRFLLGQREQALQDYRQAAELGDDSAVYLTDLADAYQYLGNWEGAATAYRAAVAVNNRYERAYQNASWLMATCPDPKYFNAELALSSARKAMELGGAARSSQMLDTLAAAMAAKGRFAEAAQLEREALEAAPVEERTELRQRLTLYENGQAYRQTQSIPALSSEAQPRTASGRPPQVRSVSGSRH